jgi:hypothetical protein
MLYFLKIWSIIIKPEQTERHAKWRALVNQQKQSGLTQREFCKEQELIWSLINILARYRIAFVGVNLKNII